MNNFHRNEVKAYKLGYRVERKWRFNWFAW